jgi:hypothetical protein
MGVVRCDEPGTRLAQHAKTEEADKVLAAVDDRFNEGLKTARALLDQFRLTRRSHTQPSCLKPRSGSRFTKIPEA